MNNWKLRLLCFSSIFLSACSKDDEPKVIPESVKAGGEATIYSAGPDAYTFPLPNLDKAGLDEHFEADAIFAQQFVTAPANKFGGIGPLFNQNSCEGCHVRNGRGAIPQIYGDLQSGLLLRLSVPGSGPHGSIIPVPGFGGQLQDKAIFGQISEGKISKTESAHVVTYRDGSTTTIYKPTYTISNPYISLPSEVLISPRLAPAVYGLGLFDAISDLDILALVDENDTNGDGISGRPNMVWDVLKNDVALGRFGWKAEQPTAAQQAADAAHNDMGLTNYYFINEHCEGQSNCNSGLQEGLDVDDRTVDLMGFYFKSLAVPASRNYDDAAVIKGKTIFKDLNCITCHTPRFVTGNYSIQALSNQTIFPYTDLLLHDMGEGLADNRPSFLANGKEWRTPPLWGIGLTQVVNPKATFLHDGRAKTLEEAILWHGGEAEKSVDNFKALSAADRNALIVFLKSL